MARHNQIHTKIISRMGKSKITLPTGSGLSHNSTTVSLDELEFTHPNRKRRLESQIHLADMLEPFITSVPALTNNTVKIYIIEALLIEMRRCAEYIPR